MTLYPTISAIIPTLNEAQRIVETLLQFRDLAGRWEIVVADSGSTDGTPELAKSIAGVRVVAAPPGRGAGLNAGASSSSGEILLFLHADTRLPAMAYHMIVRGLRDSTVAATAFRLRLDRPELRFRSVALAGDVRFLVQQTLFGDQGIAVRRDVFQRIGGYREVALMEDVDLSLRLREQGMLKLLPARVTTSARRFERGGVLRTLALMSAFQVAYRLGISPETLARWYADVR